MRCKICNFDINSNRDLLAHLKNVHGTDPISYFKKYPDAEKFCSKCKNLLPITNFLSDKSNSYGYRTQCLDCMRPGGAKRECPICKRIFKWSSVINHMNREHDIPPVDGYNLYLKEKYCPKCEKVKSLSDFAKMKDEKAVYFSWCADCNLERNIARSVSDQDFELFQYLVIRLAFSDKCFVCNMSHDESTEKLGEPLHIDHMLAHVKGGALKINNSILLCRTCNLKKGAKELEEFLREQNLSSSSIIPMLQQLEGIHNWAEIELKRVLKRSVYKN